MKMSIKKTILSIYIYAVLVLVLYSTSSVYSIVFGWTDRVAKALLVFLCLLPILFYPFKNNKFKLTGLPYIIALFILLALSLLINNSSVFNVSFFFVRFISLFVFLTFCRYRKIDVFGRLFKLCIFVCVLYLFLYFLFDTGIFNFPSQTYWFDYSYGTTNNLETIKPWFVGYYGIYFKTSSVIAFGRQINLLCGPFSEPGLFQFLINYGVFYFLFVRKQKKVLMFLVLLMSIIVCGSTMGFLSFFFIVILYLLKRKTFESGFLFVFFFTLFLVLTFYILSYKKNNTISYSSRLDDSISMIMLFFKNPFGYGFNQGQYSYNGFLTIVVSYGVFSALLIVPLFLSGKAFGKKDLITLIAFAGYLLFSLVDEPIGFSNYIIMFTVSGVLCLSRGNNIRIKTNAFRVTTSL